MGELSEFKQVAEMANMLKGAGDFIPSHFKGNPGAIAAAILTGRELGIPTMASLRSLYVVNGKVGMSYELIVGQLRRHQYKIEWLHSDDTKATIQITHKNGESFELSYLIEEAKVAQLIGRDNWKKRPSLMLRARCVATAARSFAGEIFLGMYHEDELRDIEKNVNVIDVEVDENLSGTQRLLETIEKINRDVSEEETELPQHKLGEKEKIKLDLAESMNQKELLMCVEEITSSNTLSEEEKEELRLVYSDKKQLIG